MINYAFLQTIHNDWSIEHWGTKWNAYDFELPPDGEGIVFHTAWSSVPKVLEVLSEKFPEVHMTYAWADEDFGSNTGRVEYEGGEVMGIYIPRDHSPEAYELAADIQGLSIRDFGFDYGKNGEIVFTGDMPEGREER